jgi:hypothetical protein
MRPRRSLETTKLPDDWPPPSPRYRLGVFGTVAIACGVLAALAFSWVGFTLFKKLLDPPTDLGGVVADLKPITLQPVPPIPPERKVRLPPPQLVVTQPGPSNADEVRRLDITLNGPSEGAVLLIGGLVPGSVVSAGRQVGSKGWRLPVAELENAAVTPPRGFAGSMDLMLELRLSDDSVADRKTLRLEWTAPKPVEPTFVERRLGADEISALLERGQRFVAKGDLAAARSLFQRAAEAGDARAAFALAETYDPTALEQRGERGFAPDTAMARTWYERARVFGSEEAARRLQTLGSQHR